MKIEQSTAIKLRITEIESLDPITVFLEDYDAGKGKIIVECYGKSWSAYWGGMGSKLADFFVSCNHEYLINNLAPQMDKYEPDFETFKDEMRQKICEMRADSYISKDLARELYDVGDWSQYVTANPYEPLRNPCFICSDEFEELDFDVFDVPERITTDYHYLTRIVKSVQSALVEAGLTSKEAA